MPVNILIVDDEKHTRDGLIAALEDDYDVFAATNADEAMRMLDAENFDVVLTDLRMAGKSGMSVIDKTISMPYKPVCIMMTAFGNVETAVEAMKRGAADFISKPIEIEKLELCIKRALEKRSKAQSAAAEPREEHYDYKYIGGEIIAKSRAMNAVLERAAQVAASKATVMITGETGTGKELVSQFIHKNSPRKSGPFVPVHCAAIPANLLESELFGHEKGAFTGAVAKRLGRFEAADGGTLFLDEIGEIDAATQVKLLRFLETKSFERLGGLKNIAVDIRLICATNRDLKAMARKGEFREDLYYRLNVVEINIPPLRDRPDDIAPMINFYAEFFAKENGLPALEISPAAMKVLEAYAWKGNIRELKNFCENLVVTSKKRVIEPADLGARFFEEDAPPPPAFEEAPARPAQEAARTLSKHDNELELIRRALHEAGGNKSKAAELLEISRRTLHRKLNQFPELKKFAEEA